MSTPAAGEVGAWTCPAHGGELAEVGERLECAAGHSYPKRSGIPRFVETPGYAAMFGPQWIRYRRTQLDSHTGTRISEERARRCIGEELWRRLEGLEVLECGCGAGRFTEVLLAAGARVTSVDITEAVEANQLNFPQDDRHRIAQADLLALPLPRRSFDLVFCLGVVQHTPVPEQTVAMLYEHVRPGGSLVIDHYAYRLSWFLGLGPIWRRILRRLPPERGLAWTERIVDLFYPLHSRFRRQRSLLNRVSPVHTYFDIFPDLSERHQREWALLDTHDAMTDWHKHFRTRGQIQRLLTELGLEDVWCEYGGNGVEARGRRPDPADRR